MDPFREVGLFLVEDPFREVGLFLVEGPFQEVDLFEEVDLFVAADLLVGPKLGEVYGTDSSSTQIVDWVQRKVNYSWRTKKAG